jgi:hypothetical protein
LKLVFNSKRCSATVALVDQNHCAGLSATAKVFDQTFSQKVCVQAFFKRLA